MLFHSTDTGKVYHQYVYEDVFVDQHSDKIILHSTDIGKVYHQCVYKDVFRDYYYH